jgi:hypothetical protein
MLQHAVIAVVIIGRTLHKSQMLCLLGNCKDYCGACAHTHAKESVFNLDSQI